MPTQTKNITRLLRIIARLRGPNGCPWDREQTHRSLRHNLIEETYEVLDAMDSGETSEFRDELGDLLFAAVNLARFEELHAEDLLNRTIAKFITRFQKIERAVHKSDRRLEDCTLEELDALWESAKHKTKTRRSRS